MNAPQFRKAERRKARLRLGIVGPAGSGKSFGALMLAKGLGGRTAVIDTEAGSGDLYATTFDYDIMQITAPFTPEKYLAAIKAAEAAGYDTIVLDSISHLWSGDGGLLDIHHDHDAKASKDRTQLFPATRYMKITEATGKELLEWLNSGKDTIICEHCSKAGKRVMVTEADAEASKAETG